MNTQMVNFMIPNPLLCQLDTLAENDSISRSELFRLALRDFLAEKLAKKRDFTVIKNSARGKNLSLKKAISLIDKTRKQIPINQ